MTSKTCTADECSRAAILDGLCALHYKRRWRHGNTDTVLVEKSSTKVPGAICPNCKGRYSFVVDSRPTPTSTRRRRKCLDCDHRWTTMEVNEGELQMDPRALTTLVNLVDSAGNTIDSIRSRLTAQVVPDGD